MPKPYTYKIKTAHLKNLGPGYRVAVPFGKRKIYTALVIKVHNVAPQTYEAKPIVTILDKVATVTPFQLDFWKWMATYYMCTQGEIMRACLPAALMIESETLLVKCEASEEQLEILSDAQYLVYEALQKQSLTLDEISQITDRKQVMTLVLGMLKEGVAQIHQRLEEKFKPKKVRYVKLSESYHQEDELQTLFEHLQKAPKQLALIMGIFSERESIKEWKKVSDLKAKTGACFFKAKKRGRFFKLSLIHI